MNSASTKNRGLAHDNRRAHDPLQNAEADRAFLRDVLKFTHLDVGHGWPADVDALHATALGRGVTLTMPPTNEPWGMGESGNKAIRRFDTIQPFP